MLSTKVFQSGNSQAIRIPKDYRTSREEFLITKIGETYIFTPTDDPWYTLRESIGKFEEDYMEDRNQPTWNDIDNREEF